MQTSWLCVCKNSTFLHWSFNVKNKQNRIELVTNPGPYCYLCHWLDRIGNWDTGGRYANPILSDPRLILVRVSWVISPYYSVQQITLYKICPELNLSKHSQFRLFFNLRAKRGGSLFEAGSEREENGGVTSVQKRCAWQVVEGIVTEWWNSDRRSVCSRRRYV